MSPVGGAGGVNGGAPHQHQRHSPQQQHNHHQQQTAHQHQQSTHFDPANDFSWLDLGAVGDYVSGDMTAGILGFDGGLQDGMYSADQQQQPQQQQMWQTPFWTGDSMSTSLFF